jgi:XapX domain-containing protein
MKEALLALLAGIVVGVIFKVIRLPLPAPPVLAGILGIVGIYLGGKIPGWLSKIFF